MNTRLAVAAGVGAVALAAGGIGAATQLSGSSATPQTTAPMGCNDWAVELTTGECGAAGIIRYVALHNLQGAAQFCKWKAANPGEWSRLKTYATNAVLPSNIITWMGASILNDLQAYFATKAPVFTIQPNSAPNACTGKLVAPPKIQGVTPGQTDATVTIDTT